MPPAIRSLPASNDWVNVHSLGVKGDGITDDTAALQKAVDTNRVLYFPTGYYILSDTIHLKPDTVLIGLHPGGAQFDIPNNSPAFRGVGEPKPLFEAPKGGRNIISGLGIYTTGDNPRAGEFLHLRVAADVIDVRVAAEEKLDVGELEPELLHAALDDRHGIVEARVEEDMPGGRRDQKRAHAARADVVEVADELARRDRRAPAVEEPLHPRAIGRGRHTRCDVGRRRARAPDHDEASEETASEGTHQRGEGELGEAGSTIESAVIGRSPASRKRAQQSTMPPLFTTRKRTTFAPFRSVSFFETPSSICVCRSP